MSTLAITVAGFNAFVAFVLCWRRDASPFTAREIWLRDRR